MPSRQHFLCSGEEICQLKRLLGEKVQEIDFFKGALQKVEARFQLLSPLVKQTSIDAQELGSTPEYRNHHAVSRRSRTEPLPQILGSSRLLVSSVRKSNRIVETGSWRSSWFCGITSETVLYLGAHFDVGAHFSERNLLRRVSISCVDFLIAARSHR
jgi:hypothetical protein